ncbi:hypothetical protein J7E25_13165 [Agromyces sp. ISL-38]|uniref:hypothetical protein n=1 Tax=Agromyces sp. ISL-38 TaxID=2819107 RepID=UPI001BE50F09|nr:hypothetical protein [Agromyces sp. ISL-38]MBT2500040.1 hypothetical protein [Agromyces sp. ISL-38]
MVNTKIATRQLWLTGGVAMAGPFLVGTFDLLLLMPQTISQNIVEAFGGLPEPNRTQFLVMFTIWLAIGFGAIGLAIRKERMDGPGRLNPRRRLVLIAMLLFSTASVSVLLPYSAMSIGIANVVRDIDTAGSIISTTLALVGVATALSAFILWIIWQTRASRERGADPSLTHPGIDRRASGRDSTLE